jgi:hypothetical protein
MSKNFWGYCKRHCKVLLCCGFFSVTLLTAQVPDTEKDETLDAPQAENSSFDVETLDDANGLLNETSVEKNFSALSDSYIIVGDDSSWYYETFNDDGTVSQVFWYDKDKIVKEQKFFYENNYLQKMVETSQEKNITHFYDKNQNVIKIETKISGVLTVTQKKYNAKNELTEVETEKNGKKLLQKIFYKNDGSIAYEESYTDGVLNSKIEYNGTKKRVHIFLDGKEIKVFDD